MGIVACRAAYEKGAEWLGQLLQYLYGNVAYIRDFLTAHIPNIKLIEPQGTYLAWLDFRPMGMDNGSLDRFLLDSAGLWLNPGYIFGPSGSGFQRLNFACPRSVLEQAMARLYSACKGAGV
jgi:cystathionine beta-lyase